jgi:hypothetical protein
MSLDERDYMYEPKKYRGSRATATQNTASRRPSSNGSALNAALPWLAWLVVILALAAGVKWWLEHRSALPLPTSGEAIWYAEPTSPPLAMLRLSAINQPKKHFAVRLDEWGSGRPVVLVHVRGGESAVTLVPLGRYRVTLAKGTRWQGSSKLFGMLGEVSEATYPLDFVKQGSQISGHRIELEVPFNGNMDVRPVVGR